MAGVEGAGARNYIRGGRAAAVLDDGLVEAVRQLSAGQLVGRRGRQLSKLGQRRTALAATRHNHSSQSTNEHCTEGAKHPGVL